MLGASLVSTPSDRSDFGSWCRTILVVLSVCNKIGFIDGTSSRRPDNSHLDRQWQHCNDLVVSWLTNSLSKEIARSVQYYTYARDIWIKLKKSYGKVDGLEYFN